MSSPLYCILYQIIQLIIHILFVTWRSVYASYQQLSLFQLKLHPHCIFHSLICTKVYLLCFKAFYNINNYSSSGISFFDFTKTIISIHFQLHLLHRIIKMLWQNFCQTNNIRLFSNDKHLKL